MLFPIWCTYKSPIVFLHQTIGSLAYVRELSQRYWADWAFDYYLIWSDPAARPNAFANAAVSELELDYKVAR
jgi:hypothetical protein